MLERFKHIAIIIPFFTLLIFNTASFADTPSALSLANPVIQVLEYEITEGNVELDNQFTIRITLKNNNAYSTAYNVISEVATPDMDLHLTDGQVNQIYFQSIGPNETVAFTQTFYIEKSFPYKSAFLTYTFHYSDESGKSYSNSTSLSPQVIIPCKLKINVLSVAPTASLGSRSLVNVRCTNDGTIDISNIVMNLKGDIMESQESFDLGSLKSGEQLMKDCYVNFLKQGSQALGISFTYKDEAGNTYTIPENTYAVEVTADTITYVDSLPDSGGGFNIKTFIIAIIIVVPIIYLIFKLIGYMKRGK